MEILHPVDPTGGDRFHADVLGEERGMTAWLCKHATSKEKVEFKVGH